MPEELPADMRMGKPTRPILPPAKMDIRIFESKILEAVTGIYQEPDELWETGERIWTLRRAIMVSREDRTREYDTLSHVWFEKIAGGDQVLLHQ